MRRSKRFLSLVAGFVAVTGFWGCGSGGSQVAGGESASSGQNLTFGELSVRAANVNPPVYSSGVGTSATGLTGKISSVDVRSLASDIKSTYIAFTRRFNGDQIYVAGADGSNETPIVVGTHPSWSPDGSMIAFESKANGKRGISVVNSDGSNETRITNNNATDEDPVWSPDGTKIAFTSNRDAGTDGNLEIYVMSADGSNQTRLTNNRFIDQQPAWSPDSAKIAFVSNRDGDQEIYVMNADGSSQRRLTERAGADIQPAWSPAANIAYTQLGDTPAEIGIMTPNGVKLSGFRKRNVPLAEPSWSPDGRQIVCSGNVDIARVLYVGSSDGTDVQLLTPLNFGFFQGDSVQPCWSSFRMRLPVVGVSGRMGNAATGFIYATGNHRPASVVSWNNSDFTALKLTALGGQNSTSDALIYSVEGGTAPITLTRLAYWNFTTPKATLVTSATTISGALIYIDAWTGFVNSVIPFNAPSRSVGKPSVKRENGAIVARGSFAGVWSAEGKNLAPQGAYAVRLDSRTGKVLGIETGGSR
ncbi:MAG: LpqB family beta-propeller domain-containing protein [Armatimonadetes bacterium]|nr:LpqB family beta-propeller domain-containing protein [Armatimonadota bacterium]